MREFRIRTHCKSNLYSWVKLQLLYSILTLYSPSVISASASKSNASPMAGVKFGLASTISLISLFCASLIVDSIWKESWTIHNFRFFHLIYDPVNIVITRIKKEYYKQSQLEYQLTRRSTTTANWNTLSQAWASNGGRSPWWMLETMERFFLILLQYMKLLHILLPCLCDHYLIYINESKEKNKASCYIRDGIN